MTHINPALKSIEFEAPTGLVLTVQHAKKQLRQIIAAWFKHRKFRANLRFIGQFDATVLRDLGLTPADIAQLQDRPVQTGRGGLGISQTLSLDHDLRSNISKVMSDNGLI